MNSRDAAVAELPPSEGERSRGGAFAARLRERANVVRQGWLQVFGIPDYERYLSHMALHHHADPVLTRREFFAQAIDRKYCKSGPRCC